MEREEDQARGVYGTNLPETPEHEKGVGELLEETRKKSAEELETGGMGRKNTPKEGPSQGEWHHDDEHPLDRVQRVAQNETETDEVPD